tara:strand:- start:1723 stop:2502 length:780 start_codon:yes stop_codon:yes gene_type:complete
MNVINGIRKRLRESLLNETLLNEKLTDVQIDIDYIFNKYFKGPYEIVETTRSLDNFEIPRSHFFSGLLKSELAIKANEVNPCVIEIGGDRFNSYSPQENKIRLTYSNNAVRFIRDYNNNIDEAAAQLETKQAKSLLREFSPETIKASIHHELVHWIDDSLNNNHIGKHIKKAGETNTSNSDANGHTLEIQGQIHNIVQLNNKFKPQWDTMTFTEMIQLSPALNTVIRSFSSNQLKKQWIRNIKTRMHREGLLGKNMVNT